MTEVRQIAACVNSREHLSLQFNRSGRASSVVGLLLRVVLVPITTDPVA